VTETEMRGWLAFLRAEPSATGTIRIANTVMTAARTPFAPGRCVRDTCRARPLSVGWCPGSAAARVIGNTSR
jgi:hypothetical protein